MNSRTRKLACAILAASLLMALGVPANARCYVVSRTNDGFDKNSAVAASQWAFNNGLASYKRKRGWSRITSVTAHRVRPDPLWKAVRISVPSNLILRPIVRTKRYYTVCWTGVVSPVVCTTGARVCGR